MVAEHLALPAAPECENDEGGRFTIRPSGDSHRTFRPSACAVAPCGLAARQPVAGRAAAVVAGATPQSEGLVRVRDEVGIHTSTLPSRGRSRTNNPWREGRPNAASGRGGSTRSSSGCRRCPNCPRRSPARVRPRVRWPRPPTVALAPTPRSASVSTQRPPSGFHPPSMETAGSRLQSGVPRVGMSPPCASSGLPGKDCSTRSDPPRRAWDGVHIPTSADATTGIEKGGSLRSRPPSTARHRRPGVRGATASRTTTCAIPVVHVRTGISRTSTTVLHVRLHPVADRTHSGPGSTSRVDSDHRLKTANQS